MTTAPLSFSVTWDYRCPFARNAHEHLLSGLQSGADWHVKFLAFSLDQAHVEEGGNPVWEEPERYPGLLANQAGIVVRDKFPEQFYTAHRALFAARHDRAMDLRERSAVESVLAEAGIDAGAVMSEIDQGWPLDSFRKDHETAVDQFGVFGVPTFIVADKAVFVRLLDRPGDEASRSRATIERVVNLLTDWPELNEFKHTRLPR